MATITSFIVTTMQGVQDTVVCGDVSDPERNSLYVSVGGREFKLENETLPAGQTSQFPAGGSSTFQFGSGSTVTCPADNDPSASSSYPITDVNVYTHPIYIRMSEFFYEANGSVSNPQEGVRFESISVEIIYDTPPPSKATYTRLNGTSEWIELRQEAGYIFYVKPHEFENTPTNVEPETP